MWQNSDIVSCYSNHLLSGNLSSDIVQLLVMRQLHVQRKKVCMICYQITFFGATSSLSVMLYKYAKS